MPGCDFNFPYDSSFNTVSSSELRMYYTEIGQYLLDNSKELIQAAINASESSLEFLIPCGFSKLITRIEEALLPDYIEKLKEEVLLMNHSKDNFRFSFDNDHPDKSRFVIRVRFRS